MSNEQLFNEFPPISTEQWEAVIEKDLKGADYEKKLVWRTDEGFKVRPYYRAEDLPERSVRSPPAREQLGRQGGVQRDRAEAREELPRQLR